MRIITGGVTAAKGFEAAGAEAGIKYKDRKDMAMIYSKAPCVTAGTFTSNVVKAAPVLWDQKVVEKSPFAQAVIVNAGIANAGTGKEGYSYCERTAAAAARELKIPEDSVLVASTGVIGMQLPIDRIEAGIKKLAKAKADTKEAGDLAAAAIMTTDTHAKQAAVQIEVGGATVTIGGMCKGSGMIHPNMCTMLGFLTTDAVISKELLAKALREDVTDTFNMVSVDGDTSTNDTLLILANGMAENPEILEKTPEYAAFRAKQDARILAKSVVSSSLCKSAVYGHDANWGRFLCALGYSGVNFDPEKMELYFESSAGKLLVYKDGAGAAYSEKKASEILSKPQVTVIADMKAGTHSATAWGCDLTYDYVKINADYRS